MSIREKSVYEAMLERIHTLDARLTFTIQDADLDEEDFLDMRKCLTELASMTRQQEVKAKNLPLPGI